MTEDQIRIAIRWTVVIFICALVCVTCGILSIVVGGEPFSVAMLATVGVAEVFVAVREIFVWRKLRRMLRLPRLQTP